MPYKRGYKRNYKQKGWVDTALHYGGKVASVAGKALKIATTVAALVNVEHKTYDNLNPTAGSTPYSATENVKAIGEVFYVSGIAQGSDVNQRNGNSVKLESLYLTYTAGLHPSATVNSDIRVMLVRDNDNQGAAPAVGDILKAANVISPLNITKFPGRFTVLYDKLHTLFLPGTGDNTRCVQKYMKQNFHIKYSGTGATVTDAKSGSLYLLAIGSALSNEPVIYWLLRERFIDN